MSFKDNSEWGTWNFSSNSREKMELLKTYFKCTTPNSHICNEIKNDMWRLLVGEVLSRNCSTVTQNFVSPTSKEQCSHHYLHNGSLAKPDKDKYLNITHDSDILCEDEKEKSKVNNSFLNKLTESSHFEEELESGNNDEILESIGDICGLLNKGPVEGFSETFKRKDLDYVFKAMKENLSNEESIANLILSICSPVKDDILEQSRWAPVLFQKLILPEILERNLPLSRLLSSSISRLASSFPDASVQFLCIPLLVAPLENKSLTMSSPIEKILREVIEESLLSQERVLLFRSFFKVAAGKEKFSVQENYFPILQLLAETPGAFIGAESDFLLNLISWMEISSQEHFSNPKFSKFLVAVLKGIAQDVDSREEGNAHYLTPENILRLKNIIAQSKTLFRKIAEKTLDSICRI